MTVPWLPVVAGLAAFAPAGTAHAGSSMSSDSGTILRAIERLSVVGSVLYVAAHPDDENTRLLVWLEQGQKVRAGYLSLTRGEGGQNLIGPEQAPMLGVIRTQELLAARGVDGALQLFGRERDFGYSKSADETLRIWGHDEALADVVWAIRRFRPDVIVTRFSPDDHDTHGHHTASAMLAVEAFAAAADPARFPDHQKLVQPWQAKRVVWNRGVWRDTKPEELAGFTPVDVGGYDPVLGVSWGEVAARARSMHKSQGFGASPQRGPAMEYFKVLAGEPMQSSPFDGVDLGWSRVRGSERLRELLGRARAELRVDDPAASITTLLEARDALERLPDNPFKELKLAEIDRVIVACSGLFADATAAEPSTLAGGSLKLKVTVLNRSGAHPVLKVMRVAGETVRVDKPLATHQPLVLEPTVTVPAATPLANPYWLDAEPAAGRWTVREQALVGLPELPPSLVVELVLEIGKRQVVVRRPVVHAWTDPVFGERRRPLEVLPPVTLAVREGQLVFADGNPRELRVRLRASRAAVAGTLRPEAPAEFSLDPASARFDLAEGGAEQELTFRVKPRARPAGDGAAIQGELRFVADVGGAALPLREVIRADYAHIPIQTTLPLAAVRVSRFDLERGITRVGYVPGAGDDVPAALRVAGYEVVILSGEALAAEPLERFEAIVLGVRAFNTNPRLAPLHDRLMRYVEGGGTLLVQYNTQNWMSRVAGSMGPWPLALSQERVTDETAAVHRLLPDHPVFKTPNRIVDRDFDGWVQERGLYFAGTWDDRYQTPIGMHDPGEPERQGSVVIARHGKGTFVYTGLSFFRQLPAGVSGAYRLFANLLAHGRRS